jgi:hypothetical protein
MKIKRGNLTWGVLLISLGVILLATRLMPGLEAWAAENWPVTILIIAGAFFLVGLLAGIPELSIPAVIIAGIGGLLLWQNLTGNWDSWAYVWTLIPGFAGIGILLTYIMQGKYKQLGDGFIPIFISLILFVIFGSFLGGPADIIRYWPVLLILAGVWQLLRPLIRRGTEEVL